MADIQNRAPLVSVIIPTTGNPQLKDAIASVQSQLYQNVECLVFIDGIEREPAARRVLSQIKTEKPTHVVTWPYATGKNRYQGHRIYGACSFIAEGDYLVFLDEDNWLDADHILSLIELVQDLALDWAYSLRKIVNQAGEFLIDDDCLSIGQWPCVIEKNGYNHHLDTGCFFLARSVAAHCAHIWNRQSPPEKDPDTTLANYLLKNFLNYQCSGKHSLNYRAEATEHSGSAGYFFFGNAKMRHTYKSGYPWREQSSPESLAEQSKQALNIQEMAYVCFPDWHYEHRANQLGTQSTLKAEIKRHIQQFANANTTGNTTLILFASSQWYANAVEFLQSIDLNKFFPETLYKVNLSIITEMTPRKWQAVRSQLTGRLSVTVECPYTESLQADLPLLNTTKSTLRKQTSSPVWIAPPVYPKQLKHFMILSHAGAHSERLTAFINQYKKALYCAGEIYHKDPSTSDSVYMRSVLSRDRRLSSIIDLPMFLNLYSLQTHASAVGFTLLSPLSHIPKLKTVLTLIESGLKIIYLRRDDLPQAVKGAIALEPESVEQSAIEHSVKSIPNIDKLVKNLDWYLGEVEKKLGQRKAPLLALKAETAFNDQMVLTAEVKQAVIDFLA